jgi:hypothetical protein
MMHSESDTAVLAALNELIEICRWKCGPNDEIVLPNGRSNHNALIDAVQAANTAKYVNRFGESVETAWLGKIVAVETRHGEVLLRMKGVNMMHRALKGGDINDCLDDDDTQWFAPDDVRLVTLV